MAVLRPPRRHHRRPHRPRLRLRLRDRLRPARHQHPLPRLHGPDPHLALFDPYGNTRGVAPGTGTFPGSRGLLDDPVEASTGLTSIGARWYDSATGTFTSLDPVLEKASQVQLNGYTYAGANPVVGSDPTGLMLPSDGGGGQPAPPTPTCEYIGDCSSALPPPGVAAPGAPNSDDPSGGGGGTASTGDGGGGNNGTAHAGGGSGTSHSCDNHMLPCSGLGSDHVIKSFIDGMLGLVGV